MRGFLGRPLNAITLNQGDDLATEALTDNYLKCRIAGRHPANRWLSATVTGVDGEELLATAAT